MRWRLRLLLALLALLCITYPVYADPASSLCRCTCGSNSTSIALDNNPKSDTGESAPKSDVKKARGTCADCNKKFCLDYNLPICKDTKEEDVSATCFERDSKKDKAVVIIFIVATVGLLSYSAVQPWVQKWTDKSRAREAYAPVSSQGAEES